MKRVINRLLSAVFCVALAVLTLCFSIGLPIYIRPFYYVQIEPLGLPDKTGYSVQEIRAAYDEVLDYLTLPNRAFGTGVFPFSEEGASHFADCKGLFTLNSMALVASAAVVITLAVLHRRKVVRLCRVKGYPLPFLTGVGLLAVFVAVGALAALYFDEAFTVFHALFFPGKDNWLLDYTQDGIILAMPQTFFMRCALLIGGTVIGLSLVMIGYGVRNKRHQKT